MRSRSAFVLRPVALLALCGLVLGGAARPARAADPAALFTLDTGLRAVIHPEADNPFVAINVLVRAGAPEEGLLPGVGDLASRCLFGDSYNETADSQARSIARLGGNLECRWMPDYTSINLVTTPDRVDQALYTIAQALSAAQFDLKTLSRAQREILADRERQSQKPFPRAYEAVRDALCEYPPYRGTFGGSSLAVRRIGQDALQQFLMRRYTPANTVVSIAGGVTAQEAQRLVVRNFEHDYARTPARPAYISTAPLPPPADHVVLKLPTSTVLVVAGYRAPGICEADYPAYAVLNAIVGGGKSSRLFRRVRDTAGIGYVVASYIPPLANANVMMAYVEFSPARDGTGGAAPDAKAVEKMITETVQSIIDTPPSEQEVERARRFVAGAHALAHQRTRDRAFYQGWYELLGVGYRFDEEYPKRVGQVTAADVARVAAKYLKSGVVVVVQPYDTAQRGGDGAAAAR